MFTLLVAVPDLGPVHAAAEYSVLTWSTNVNNKLSSTLRVHRENSLTV